MHRTWRILAILIAILLPALAALAIFGYRLLHRSLPDYHGALELPSLSAPVEVFWDAFHVPHVYAQNNKDLFRAAGYLAAQERMWQMELCRRLVRGTLSEVFGERTLELDKLSRIMGFQRTAERISQQLSRASAEALGAYAEGINDFLLENPHRLPVEFSLVGFKPGSWQITDSIGFIRIMGFQLSYAWHLELSLFEVARRVGLLQALELFPDVPRSTPVIVSESGPSLPDATPAMAAMRQLSELIGGSGTVAASNSWVVAGERSTSGKPLLANDPHLALSLPNIWFEMHLVGGDYNVMGVVLPAVPGIAIGQNPAAAWGMTTGMVDDMDFYIEKTDPENPGRYWDGNGWQDFQTVRERIDIKGRDEPEFMDVHFTRHGPIISEMQPAAAGQRAISLRWTGFAVSDELSAALQINRATSWESFSRALESFKVPCHNYVYADTSGTIGYYAAGAVPVRKDGKGYLPYNGWEQSGEWTGYVPFARMPHSPNPKSGAIATANNRMAGENFGYYLGNGWEPDSRIRRVEMILDQKEKFSPDDFATMQTDLVNLQARKILPGLVATLRRAPLDENDSRILELLDQWNFVESPESVPAALYNVLFSKLLNNCLKDEMGDTLFQAYTSWSNLPIRAMEALLGSPGSAWWDNKGTPEVETMPEILLQSFHDTVAELNEKLGNGPGFWEWGRLHQVTFEHLLGKQKPLDRLFNRGPFPLGGSANTIPKAEFLYFAPYGVKVAASMRQIIDLARPLEGRRVIAGGQSGQVFAKSYDDQIDLWRRGAYRMTSLSRPEISRTAIARQVLAPAVSD